MNVKGCPVRKKMCESCPFREGADRELKNAVLARTLFQASQVCHHPRLEGGREHEICRGQRNEQLVLMHRLGWIEAPTDVAFTKKQNELEKNGDIQTETC